MSPGVDPSAPAQVAIDSLFDYDRLPSGWPYLAFCLYFPLGCVFLLLRFFIALHVLLVSLLLPQTFALRSWILRPMCFVLGVVVVENNDQKSRWSRSATAAPPVVVSTHLTPLDHLAFCLLRPYLLPRVYELPALLTRGFGLTDVHGREGSEVFIDDVRRCQKATNLSILAFPEAGTTNGRVGLLKFSSWPFKLGFTVQPALVSVCRPSFAQVSPTVVGSRWWNDVLWFLFVPFTILRVRWLTPVTKGDDETSEDFVRRVQKTMALAAELCPTEFTVHDAVEFTKRYLFSQEAERKENSNAQQKSSDLSHKRLPSTAGKTDLQTLFTDPSTWRAAFEQKRQELIEINREKYLQRHAASKSSSVQ